MKVLQDILLILFLSMPLGWAAQRKHFPAVVVYILLGIIIGPPLLGWIESGKALESLGQLGVLLLLGVAGLRLGLARLVNAGWPGLWVALLGMFFCLAGGYVLAIFWGSTQEEAVYVGTALTATSIGVSVQALQQFGLIERSVGRIVIAAAIIDDVVALYLLALAHGILGEGLEAGRLLWFVVQAAFVLAVVFLVCRLGARFILQSLGRPDSALRVWSSILLILAFAWLTAVLGYSLVVGSFFAGLGLGEGLTEEQQAHVTAQLERLVMILVPFFFVLIGSRSEWQVLLDEGMPLLVAALLVVAITGKVAGGFAGARKARGIMQRLLIGVSMAPRGEVALVVAGLGFAQGHISHHMLVALVLASIGTAVVSPILMNILLRYT